MTLISFIRQMMTSHSGISSKRVCGVIGWFACLGVLVYCTIVTVLAPLMIDTVLLCCMGLLGIDSVTGIWKRSKPVNDRPDNRPCKDSCNNNFNN